MVISNLYKNLMEHWKKDGYSIYKDQDLSVAGKNDCEELYLNDPLEAEVKNQLATELIEMFFENYHRQYVDDDIINYLNRNPLVRYYFAFEEKLNVYIKRLRQKIEDDVKKPKYVETVRGIGYRWAMDVRER